MIRRMLVVGMVILGAPLGAQGAGQPLRLSLSDALARADSASATVAMARAGVLRADAEVIRARAGYLPQLSGSATYTRTLQSQFSGFAGSGESDSFPAPVDCKHYQPNPSLSISQRLDSLERGLDCTANGSQVDFSKLPFGRPNNYNFGLAASQSLFNRRTSGMMAAANAGRDAAEAGLSSQRAAAVLEVARAYFDALLGERLFQIADSGLILAERAYSEAQLQRQVGNVAQFDLLRASVLRDNQRPIVIQRRSFRDQSMLRLRQLLEIPAGTLITLATPLSDTSAITVPAFAASSDTSIGARAPVRQAEAVLRASDGQLGAARGGRLPTLSLSSAFAEISFPERVFNLNKFVTDWTVSLRMDVPLYTGGRIRADLLSAEAARQDASARVRQARQQAQLDVSDSQNQLLAAESAWTASSGTAGQASQAYAIAEVRYRNGISTLIELADSRLLLEQAQINRAQAARDLQLARLRVALLRDLPFGATAAAPGSF